MNTDKFEFKIANEFDKPAIWFRLHDRDVLVNPFMLYNLFCNCEGDEYFSKGITARFNISKDEVFGSFRDDSFGYYDIEFQRNSFVESALRALDDLCNATIRGEVTIYYYVEKGTAEKMKSELNNLIIPRNYYQIRENEIKVERFLFNFVKPYSCDTHFVIMIGNREYESNLSDWSTDFNLIRMDIEKFILTYNAEIKLHYEDSPTIIRLSKPNLFDSNYWPSKKDVTKVTIIPDEFAHMPIMCGYCEPRQLISELYLGLLSICIGETDWFDRCGGYEGNWDDLRLAIYNKLQSCMIENYINGITEDDFTFYPRQRVINSVDAMKDDFKNLKNTHL